MTPKYAAVVLAAGMSTRAGPVNKLLLPFRENTLLGCVLDAVRASAVTEIMVVTGHEAERIRPVISAHLTGAAQPWRIIHAPDFADGLSASLKAGIHAVHPKTLGTVVCLGDMPLVTSKVIDLLIKSQRPQDMATVPTRDGKWGNPVLLSRALFPEVMRLTGDQGARRILKQAEGKIRLLEIADPAIETDIDTPEMLENIDPPSRHSPT
jgi:molybdenum cofactor cytidylyltransferase